MRLRSAVLITVLVVSLALLDTSLVRGRPVAAKQDKESVAIALAGEFRTVFANILWIKADQYHHEFIEHGGDWAKDTDLLGLNRLITKLDPHFEEAYAAGARMLIEARKPKDAKSLLEEGITNNPNSVLLHDELGTMLAIHLQDYKSSLFHLKRAYLLSKDKWDRRRLLRLVHSVEKLAG